MHINLHQVAQVDAREDVDHLRRPMPIGGHAPYEASHDRRLSNPAFPRHQ
jgi:hypothetical protein